MAANTRLRSRSTAQVPKTTAQPSTSHTLDGDTLLGLPDHSPPPRTSPSKAAKRHLSSAGRIEKNKTAKKSSLASKLLRLFTSFPSPKQVFFSRHSAPDNAAIQTNGTAPALEAEAAHAPSPPPSDDSAMDSIESASGSVAGGSLDDEEMSDGWTPGEQDEPEFTDWREEQLALNIVLRARHEFTLLPSTWKYNLRGIPIPDTLFYTQTKSKSMRPRIYAMQERLEFEGETAFRRLIDVHAHIRDLRRLQVEVNSDRKLPAHIKESKLADLSAATASKISRAIERACLWAENDGDLRRLRNHTPPNLMISTLPSTEEHGDVFIQNSMDVLARRWRQKLGIPELDREREDSVTSSVDWYDELEEGDTTIKIEEEDNAIITKELSESPQLGAETPKASRSRRRSGADSPRDIEISATPEIIAQQLHQEAEAEAEVEEDNQRTPTQRQHQPAQPADLASPTSQTKAPVLFGFVIYKHTLMIVTLDAQDPAAPCNIPISLNMAESNQHQWNALAIMVTICWARDLLVRVVNEIEVDREVAKARMPSEDPDA